jgi:hypothetical protein
MLKLAKMPHEGANRCSSACPLYCTYAAEHTKTTGNTSLFVAVVLVDSAVNA